jgi:general secretion pathway protein F
MKRFSYAAIDAQGQAVQGTVEAADWAQAAQLLAARGLTECRQVSVEDLPELTPADAVELAGYLSELARTGVPLDGTLRALGQDATSPALRQAIDDLSDKLSSGQPLDAALDSLGARLPEHMRRLLVAASRSGRLSQALARLLERQSAVDDMTRRFRQAVLYPLVLLGLLLAWLLYMSWDVIPQFVTLLRDDFQTETNWLLESVEWWPPVLMGSLAAVAALLVAVRLAGGAAALSRLLSILPVVGPCRRYRGLSDASGLLSEFLDEQVPLDEALRLTAIGARDPAVRAACQAAAEQVAQGSMLSTSLERKRAFPATLVRWTQWGEHHAALSEALRSASIMFAERFELRLQLARVFVPAIVFGLIAASALFVAGSIFQGLFRLITDLSGSGSTTSVEGEWELWTFVTAAAVLVFGTAMLVIGQLLRSRGAAEDVTKVILSFIGWTLVALAVLAVFLLVGSGWGFVAWIVLAIAWIRGVFRYRQAQKESLWSALSLAADKQTPLAPMARAFAEEQGGGFAIRARQLARHLEGGAGLAEAIAWCPSALPAEAALAARIGTDSGDLPGAVRAASARRGGRLLVSPALLWLLMFVPVVIFVKVKIEPSLIAIFDDFETNLPGVTVAISQLIGSPVLVYLGMMLILLLVAVWLQWRGTWQPRLPGLKQIVRWIELAPVLRMLSLTTRHGRPLPQTLETIAMWHPRRWVRRRMRGAVRDLARGISWQESLGRRNLLGPDDLAVLAAAERNGNLPWALGEMGQSYARRADFRLKAWNEFASPLLLVLMGLAVGLFVVAYFLPLVYLIINLSSN